MGLSVRKKLIGVAIAIVILAMGSIGWTVARSQNKQSDSMTQGSSYHPDNIDGEQLGGSHDAIADKNPDTAPTVTKTPTEASAEASQTSVLKPTYSEPPTTSQQQTQAYVQPAPTCNESMKTSYINLYNSQVSAENASWSNQINSWNNQAAERGMGFSGYTQGMIDQYKPAHNARLAQLQTQYQQNLALVNCSA